MGKLTRIFDFDAAHRVMNEKMKCFNLHGHRFHVELTFRYSEVTALGYAIDFKEIKRLAGTWLDESFDHATILNPLDEELIAFCKKNGWRLYVMGLGDVDDTNPSAENLASEIFYCIDFIFRESFGTDVVLENVRLYETPNCWVDVDGADYEASDGVDSMLTEWAKKMGVVNYDIREDAKA